MAEIDEITTISRKELFEKARKLLDDIAYNGSPKLCGELMDVLDEIEKKIMTQKYELRQHYNGVEAIATVQGEEFHLWIGEK